MHDVFHLTMLRKYEPDSFHVISLDDVELKENATYVKKPTKITAQEERKLRTKVIPMVKIIWQQD